MSVNIYLVLLGVLLVLNLIFWILIIWFRILLQCEYGKCCSSESSDDNESPRGHRNLGFDNNEDLYNTRPYTISEPMESPPSYEEALKYEQFGFHVTSRVHTTLPSSSSSSSSQRSDSQNTFSSDRRLQQSSNSPPRIADMRARSSTNSINSILTPIREEEIDETPVTVVIDCIGIQASRLIKNCNTKIDISGGEELNGQSKC